MVRKYWCGFLTTSGRFWGLPVGRGLRVCVKTMERGGFRRGGLQRLRKNMQRRLYVASAGLIPLRLWRYKIAAAQSDRGFFAACLARHRTFNNLCPPKEAAEKPVVAVIRRSRRRRRISYFQENAQGEILRVVYPKRAERDPSE